MLCVGIESGQHVQYEVELVEIKRPEEKRFMMTEMKYWGALVAISVICSLFYVLTVKLQDVREGRSGNPHTKPEKKKSKKSL